jgi:hypothetical protein
LASGRWSVAFLLATATSAPAASLRIDPPLVDLGAYSAHDYMQTAPSEPSPLIVVQSDAPWELRVTVLTPPRRINDGLEHPLLDRLEMNLSTLPVELFLYQPFSVESGPGAPAPETLPISIPTWEAVLLRFLEEEDPPGVYRADLRCELTSPGGQPLAPALLASIEFDVEPWLVVERGGPEVTLDVDSPGFSTPGGDDEAIMPVRIRGNTPWQLRVRTESALVAPGGNRIPLEDRFSDFASVPGGGEWTPLIGAAVPVSELPTRIAEGRPVMPFQAVDVEIPLLLSYELGYSPPVGRYDTRMEVQAVPIGF